MTAPGSGPAPMPSADITVDEQILADLVRRQFPALASEPIEIVTNGWDNVVARLGSSLALRVPRRRAAVDLIDHEWTWLPTLALLMPIEVPAPLHRGRPDASIPWAWTIVHWIDGTPADAAPAPTAEDADRVAAVLRALAVPAPDDAPANPYRGVPLRQRAERVHSYLECFDEVARARLRAIWQAAVAAPDYAGPPVWVHGDLHPANLVCRDDHLVGIIDWGDLTAGDPAADLQIAWTWFGPDERARLLGALDVDAATVLRARGNALAHGAATVASSADNPRMAAVGAATIRQVLLDP